MFEEALDFELFPTTAIVPKLLPQSDDLTIRKVGAFVAARVEHDQFGMSAVLKVT